MSETDQGEAQERSRNEVEEEQMADVKERDIEAAGATTEKTQTMPTAEDPDLVSDLEHEILQLHLGHRITDIQIVAR